ncbi:uncharacterized protein LOC123548110 [Mercenaria mercenaria]|uniref:uncharacterized protein LOC123548110 n=1 Tax=Mercenaria mercenaria TaxID=6596 RepID=UPI00234E8744|nr:uncharacterized protein LOC123548110 [Mercenaria mercenaria]
MFRQFYAEQKMADPRDSWYTPNLLYNIHYRPPKPPSPPKMMVVTREFNPSVCTCGEHGCVPHYRMEREVIWSNKEVRKEADINVKEVIQAEADAKPQMESFSDLEDDSNEDEEDDANGKDGEEWKNDESSGDRLGDIKEADNLTIIAKYDADSLPRRDDLTKQSKTEHDVVQAISVSSIKPDEDYEEFGSSFGIMSVYCSSDLHKWNSMDDSVTG